VGAFDELDEEEEDSDSVGLLPYPETVGRRHEGNLKIRAQTDSSFSSRATCVLEKVTGWLPGTWKVLSFDYMVRLGNTLRSPCDIFLPLVLRIRILNWIHVQEFIVRVSRGIARGVKLCNRTICSTEGGDKVLEWMSPSSSLRLGFGHNSQTVALPRYDDLMPVPAVALQAKTPTQRIAVPFRILLLYVRPIVCGCLLPQNAAKQVSFHYDDDGAFTPTNPVTFVARNQPYIHQHAITE
jgi:hypothetical protein